MKTEFSLKAVFNATPEVVFKAWMSSDGHSAMTGSHARVEPRVGGAFTAWDGYISGKTLELKPYARIVQAWRTSEFADSDPNSRLEITLEAAKNGTQFTLVHKNLPAGPGGKLQDGLGRVVLHADEGVLPEVDSRLPGIRSEPASACSGPSCPEPARRSAHRGPLPGPSAVIHSSTTTLRPLMSFTRPRTSRTMPSGVGLR